MIEVGIMYICFIFSREASSCRLYIYYFRVVFLVVDLIISDDSGCKLEAYNKLPKA